MNKGSKFLSGVLAASFALSLAAIPASAADTEDSRFQPSVTYEITLTDEERAIIHQEVDKISGYDGKDFVYGDGTYDPNTLLGAMLVGSSNDSISYGSRAGTIPTEYPFAVDNTEANRNEGQRKTKKFEWVVQLAENLGFPVVVQRQSDKVVYVEIGDPDAPEMIMALSHLDSPSMSVDANKLPIWVNYDGEKDDTAYHTPYVKDGWIYGAGMQDDSGPTLATLLAAKALMEAGLPMDRRIRIVMGAYEDANPGVPSIENTLAYMDIPYYDRNPSFYDNWCYKSLNREETPIAAYTSDSRFPVIIGNTGAVTPYVTMDLSDDADKPFSLVYAGAGVTKREGDDTLKDVVTGSTQQIASRAVFVLNAEGVSEADRTAFINAVTEAAKAEGWLPAAQGETPKVAVSFANAPSTLSAADFDDVEAGSAMDWLIRCGLMNGTGAKTFSPEMELSRAMIAQVLYRLESSPAVEGASAFTDVAAGSWYADAVNWAAANEIVSGDGNGIFSPTTLISREQLAVILFNYAKREGLSTSGGAELDGYSDKDSVSEWASEALAWAVGRGVLTAADNTLDPAGTVDRAAFAQTLKAYLDSVSYKDIIPVDAITIEINTGVSMEMPTPQYGKNAVVWGMYLLSKALPEDSGLKLATAANGFTNMFYSDSCKEGEAYLGRNLIGLPESLLRNPSNGAPNFTIAPMCLSGQTESFTLNLVDFCKNNTLSIPTYLRYMHTNEEDFNISMNAFWVTMMRNGFELLNNRGEQLTYTFSNRTLYLDHDNPLTALQYASYVASIESNPEEFSDIYYLLDISYPLGTTGGTLASNFSNKMTAFGAVIPGNERWWHASNERMKVDAAIEMTKIMADGMLEMARYSGPAGAQLMWAEIDGLNADRADLDLLDVTIGTYRDASGAVSADSVGKGNVLLGATDFEIHMWKQRGNVSFTDAQYKLGHEEGGVYLPLNDEDFIANTFVMPMRLEFKVEKPEGMSDARWTALKNGEFSDFTFKILQDGKTVTLTAPAGQDASKYFSVRTSQYSTDAVYVSVNLAIVDGTYSGESAVLADSKTDLFKLNDEWLKNNENPFPERGQVEQRGFFVIADGDKNACFESPDAIFVTAQA